MCTLDYCLTINYKRIAHTTTHVYTLILTVRQRRGCSVGVVHALPRNYRELQSTIARFVTTRERVIE